MPFFAAVTFRRLIYPLFVLAAVYGLKYPLQTAI